MIHYYCEGNWTESNSCIVDSELFYWNEICLRSVSSKSFNSLVSNTIFIFRMDSLVGIIDIAPTLLDIAGVVPPEKMDGKSLKPILDDR